MTSPAHNIQSVLLERVRSRIPDNVSFADELGELLNISRDSAYRRIRGETVLSLEELKILYLHFGISLDELFSEKSEMVTFHRRVVSHKDYDLQQWENSIVKNLDFLGTFETKQLLFAAKDIPVFHYFRRPELSAFKHFFWMKTLIGYPALEGEKYRKDLVPRELLATGERIWARYSALPGTEIWNEQCIYDTLRQIEFYSECGFFSNDDQAVILCDELAMLLDEVKEEAARGIKSAGGDFKLYNNEILIADNTVFAKMGDRRCVYVNQNTLNLLLTFQEPFCEQTESYLRNLIKKSTLISDTAERERNRFFNSMKKQVDVFRGRFT